MWEEEEADGDEEVGALRFFGDGGAVADGVGASGVDLDVAFVADVAVLGDVALGVVGVHVVGAHADGVGGGEAGGEVVFGHHEVADHAAGFADVDLVGPVVVVGEFVLGEAPLAHFVADFLGNGGVVGEEVEPALLVGFVFGDDFTAFLVGCFGVVVVHADVVGGEGAVVVGVGFEVGGGVEFAEDVVPAALEVAGEEGVLVGVVAFGFGEGNAVGGDFGEAHAEVVGLDAVVAVAVVAGRVRRDAGEEAAGGVVGDAVGGDGVFELVFDGGGLLDAVEGFVVGGVGFAADVVGDAGGGEEVAFVGGVEEHFSGESFSGEGGDGGDFGTGFVDPVFAVEQFVAVDGDVEFLDEGFEGLFGDVRFEDPHGVVFLAVAGVFVGLLVEPGGGLVVVFFETLVEVSGESADGVFVAGIGPAESAAGESAEVFVGGDNDGGLAHFFGLDGGDDSGGGAAVDDDIGLFGLQGEGEEREE